MQIPSGEAHQQDSGGFTFSSTNVSVERRAISSPVNSSGSKSNRAHTSNQAFRKITRENFFTNARMQKDKGNGNSASTEEMTKLK